MSPRVPRDYIRITAGTICWYVRSVSSYYLGPEVSITFNVCYFPNWENNDIERDASFRTEIIVANASYVPADSSSCNPYVI